MPFEYGERPEPLPVLVSRVALQFRKSDRHIILHIGGGGGTALLAVPEHIMADVVGQFIKTRLFGLH